MMSKTGEYSVRYHEEMAMDRFLCQLAADLDLGRHVQALPEELALAMLVNLRHAEDFEREIEGEVAL